MAAEDVTLKRLPLQLADGTKLSSSRSGAPSKAVPNVGELLRMFKELNSGSMDHPQKVPSSSSHHGDLSGAPGGRVRVNAHPISLDEPSLEELLRQFAELNAISANSPEPAALSVGNESIKSVGYQSRVGVDTYLRL